MTRQNRLPYMTLALWARDLSPFSLSLPSLTKCVQSPVFTYEIKFPVCYFSPWRISGLSHSGLLLLLQYIPLPSSNDDAN